jgi:hypothetical protein
MVSALIDYLMRHRKSNSLCNLLFTPPTPTPPAPYPPLPYRVDLILHDPVGLGRFQVACPCLQSRAFFRIAATFIFGFSSFSDMDIDSKLPASYLDLVNTHKARLNPQGS